MNAAALHRRTAFPEWVQATVLALCLLLLLAAVVVKLAVPAWRAPGDTAATARQAESQDVQDVDPFALPFAANLYLTGT